MLSMSTLLVQFYTTYSSNGEIIYLFIEYFALKTNIFGSVIGVLKMTFLIEAWHYRQRSGFLIGEKISNRMKLKS